MKEPKSKANLHRPLIKIDDLDAIFSVQSKRLVNNDFTIQFKCQWYQLEKTQPTLITPKVKITIEERLDQTIRLRLKTKYLAFHKIAKPVKEQRPETFALTSNPGYRDLPQMARTPKPNHPWKTLQPILTRN